jgi:hypothetical protein
VSGTFENGNGYLGFSGKYLDQLSDNYFLYSMELVMSEHQDE